MNPIPLSAPDGTVHSYICGACLCHPSSPTWARKTPPAERVANAFDRAAKCCQCSCGEPMPAGVAGWRSYLWRCPACLWWMLWCNAWRDIGAKVSPDPDAHPSTLCRCGPDPDDVAEHLPSCPWIAVRCKACAGAGYCPTCTGDGIARTESP